MRFCDKLPKVRKENNYSQEQLADKMGVSRQAVSKWESGVSYPDMDKMLQLCTILNCNLEDLMDDGKVGKASNNKINFSKYLDDLLKFITKTYNMFCSMKAKNVFACFVEMGFIFLLLLLFGNNAFEIVNSITIRIINIIPGDYLNFLKTILSSIYSVLLIVLGVIIFIHLFKVRYLDYYITIEDDNSDKKEIEEPVEKIDLNNKRETVIIRDPKHSSPSFFNLLGKVVAFCLKCFIAMVGLGFISSMAFFIFCLAICICYIKYSTLFIYGSLAVIGAAAINYVFIELICKFVFDRKQNLKRCFLLGLGGLIIGALGCGLFFVKVMKFNYVDSAKNIETKTLSEVITVKDNTVIEPEFIDFDNVEYIEDNSLGDQAKLELIYPVNDDYGIHNNNDDEFDYYYVFSKGDTFVKEYKTILKDLKKGIIRDYSAGSFKLKIYSSNSNYDVLVNNYNKMNSDIDEDYDN